MRKNIKYGMKNKKCGIIFFGIFVILPCIFFVPSVSAAGISAGMIKRNDVKRIVREIKKKADVNKRDWFGRTPLMKAVRFNAVESAELLIANGAEINAKDKNGWTALIWASVECSSSSVKLLIERGADAAVSDKLGYTALMFAENKKCAEICVMLKEALKTQT
ncbi:MAG: ankyrin repeat domain-containing protein, partial [Elusimicrobia bacterium]|nr:ankyrin repeat domain-containing protein [Elusimicrobiota bacterium]